MYWHENKLHPVCDALTELCPENKSTVALISKNYKAGDGKGGKDRFSCKDAFRASDHFQQFYYTPECDQENAKGITPHEVPVSGPGAAL